MDTWEYMHRRIDGHFWESEEKSNEDFLIILNALGEYRWELVTAETFHNIEGKRWTECLFKRQI